MAYALGGSSEQPDTARSPNRASGKVIRKAYIILVMVITGVFYLNSNLTYQDKSFYLASRRPASAACLREYIFAPTYCERYVFQWSINRVPLDAFAWPLQNHSLSVFARQQTWSMQGDVILGRVFSPETPASSGARWVEGSTGTPADYSDYQHLNLMVTPAYSSAWNVELPENLRSAALLSASGFLDEDYRDAVDGSITFAVYITSPDLGEQLIYSRAADVPDRGWDSFNLSLTEYQGKEITIRFTIEGESEMLAALYRYPMIRLELADLEGSEGRPETQPVNTELSTQAVQAQRDDHVFILTEAQISNMTPYTREPFTWLVQGDPYLYFILLEPLSLKEYAWVSFRVQAPADMPSPAAEIFLFVVGQERPYYVVIPLLLDGKMHTYSYPLRLLDATGDLTALRLDPVMILPASGKSMVTVNDVRLISQP